MKIDCRCLDVEILPNFFSITVISLNDYLEIFGDCVDSKGKPIPLVQKISVEEIKKRLDKVKCDSMFITDKDDSQLIPMLGYFTTMRRQQPQVNIFSFNGKSYDNFMVAAFLMKGMQFDKSKDLITFLYEFSKKLIDNQDNKEFLYKDYQYREISKFALPYLDLDVMRIFALNKASVIVDSKTGERKSVPKSLKQTSINLQWYELLEYELPPINEIESELYQSNPRYKGMSAQQLNRLIDTWDRYILDEYIPDMMYYNRNDVFIVCEIIRLNPDEIKSRYSVTSVYKVNVLNSSRSKMGDVMFEKFYSEFTGLRPEEWKGQKTERTAMNLGKIIFSCIEFKTETFKKLLNELKKTTLYRIGKDEFSKEIKFKDVVYTMATGGLHSQDRPMEIWSTSDYGLNGDVAERQLTHSSTGEPPFVLLHADVASFYPSIMAEYEVAPKHMIGNIFAKLVRWMRDTRVEVKHTTESTVNGIPKDVLALVLKIVINSIYGKFGYEKGALYDRLAVLKVTINGQLMLLMLCEEFELNNMSVISANTDGIMVKVYEQDIDKCKEIVNKWQEKTKMGMDIDILHCLICRDINNYVAQFRTKKGIKLEVKGAMNPNMYRIDLSKGYSMPIVAQAVLNYFLDNKPIMQSLRECDNILDFCLTQNIGRQFHVEQLFSTKEGVKRITSQRYVRFYISNHGCIIKKVHNDTGAESGLAAGQVVTVLNTLDDKDIVLRDINYKFYYEEVMKIINPIKLGISPKGKGKTRIKKAYGAFNRLFD